jgi:hypothetical protein
MLQAQQVEELICLVSGMDRQQLLQQFHTYDASFPLDFTPDFLQSASLERLQHIFLAVCLQSQRMPSMRIAHAA